MGTFAFDPGTGGICASNVSRKNGSGSEGLPTLPDRPPRGARVYVRERGSIARGSQGTEGRCPVFNLISGAGVKVETLWIREEID